MTMNHSFIKLNNGGYVKMGGNAFISIDGEMIKPNVESIKPNAESVSKGECCLHLTSEEANLIRDSLLILMRLATNIEFSSQVQVKMVDLIDKISKEIDN